MLYAENSQLLIQPALNYAVSCVELCSPAYKLALYQGALFFDKSHFISRKSNS